MAMPTTEAQWDAACWHVTDAMRIHTRPHVTPLSTVISHHEGTLLGTAGYISLLGKTLLITNDHNFKDPDRTQIAAQFAGNDGYFRLHHTTYSSPLPIDVGVSLIDPAIWNLLALQPHRASPIPEAKLASRHAPVEEEILFFKGFAGEGSTFLFNNLLVRTTSYSAKEVPLPNGWGNERMHFAIEYRPDFATSLNKGYGLPQPKGFSGSLVWNTHYVEAVTRGFAWKPEHAEVTGIVWGWPSSAACIMATRIEYVRAYLLRALEDMRTNGDIVVA